MNNVILYHKTGAKSAPKLAKYLGFDLAKSLLGEEERRPYIVRWGNRKKIPLLPEHRTLNRRKMLDRCGNRIRQLERLRSVGVSTPPFYTSDGIHPISEHWHGLLGRDLGADKQTFGGQGISFYPDPHGATPPKDHDLYVAFIPKDRQFRVHVIGHETRTRELIPESEEAKDQPVWNYGAGFLFKYPDGKDIPHQVVPAAVQALKALWLDFGAVDVITYEGKAYVLEVNTSPGLSDPSLEWYGDNIANLLGLNDYPGWDAEGLEQENDQ